MERGGGGSVVEGAAGLSCGVWLVLLCGVQGDGSIPCPAAFHLLGIPGRRKFVWRSQREGGPRQSSVASSVWRSPLCGKARASGVVPAAVRAADLAVVTPSEEVGQRFSLRARSVGLVPVSQCSGWPGIV